MYAEESSEINIWMTKKNERLICKQEFKSINEKKKKLGLALKKEERGKL